MDHAKERRAFRIKIALLIVLFIATVIVSTLALIEVPQTMWDN